MQLQLATQFAKDFLEKLMPACIRGEIVGSVKRADKPEVHDIELLLIAKTKNPFQNSENQVLSTHQSCKKFLLILNIVDTCARPQKKQTEIDIRNVPLLVVGNSMNSVWICSLSSRKHGAYKT